jgi:CheY-like chemotaxis protein
MLPEVSDHAGRPWCVFDYNRTASVVTQMTTEPMPLVLVVDDYQDAREMYAEYLSFSGFRVVEASTGHEALEKAFELRPDVILMDLSLPGMDGWAATRQLKSDDRTRAIPVVALTGHALAGASEGARQAGCDAFVTKPCLPEELVVEVRRVLHRVEGSAGLPRR